MNKLSYYLVIIAGILLCLFFIPHSFLGTPEVFSYIEKGLVAPEVSSAFVIIWMFSSVAMLLLGVWILFLAKPIKNGTQSARIQALIIGVAMLVFWTEAYIYKPEMNHLVGFLIVGFLLIGSFLSSKN